MKWHTLLCFIFISAPSALKNKKRSIFVPLSFVKQGKQTLILPQYAQYPPFSQLIGETTHLLTRRSLKRFGRVSSGHRMENCYSPTLFAENSSIKNITIQRLQVFRNAYEPIHGYLCLPICAFGVITNIIHILVLTSKNMRNSAVNVILTAIAICDAGTMLSYLIYLAHFVLTPKDYCGSFMGWGWMFFLMVHISVSIALHTSSLWLAVTMAFIRLMTLRQGSLSSGWQKSDTAWKISGMVYLSIIVLCVPTVVSHKIIEFNRDHWHAMCQTNMSRSDYINDTSYAVYTIDISPVAVADHCSLYKANLWLTGIMFKVIPSIFLVFLSCSLLMRISAAEKNRRRLLGGQPKKRDNKKKAGGAGNKTTSEIIASKSSSNGGRKMRKVDHTTVMLITILFVFLLTELPQGVIAIMNAIFLRDVTKHIYHNLDDFMDLLSLINASVNFVLYCVMSSRYRQTFWKVILPRKTYIFLFIRKGGRGGGGRGTGQSEVTGTFLHSSMLTANNSATMNRNRTTTVTNSSIASPTNLLTTTNITIYTMNSSAGSKTPTGILKNNSSAGRLLIQEDPSNSSSLHLVGGGGGERRKKTLRISSSSNNLIIHTDSLLQTDVDDESRREIMRAAEKSSEISNPTTNHRDCHHQGRFVPTTESSDFSTVSPPNPQTTESAAMVNKETTKQNFIHPKPSSENWKKRLHFNVTNINDDNNKIRRLSLQLDYFRSPIFFSDDNNVGNSAIPQSSTVAIESRRHILFNLSTPTQEAKKKNGRFPASIHQVSSKFPASIPASRNGCRRQDHNHQSEEVERGGFFNGEDQTNSALLLPSLSSTGGRSSMTKRRHKFWSFHRSIITRNSFKKRIQQQQQQ